MKGLSKPINIDTSDLRRNNTVTMDGSYTAVNYEVTVINSPYFTYLILIVLWPFLEVPYKAKNNQKWPRNRVFYRLRHYTLRL